MKIMNFIKGLLPRLNKEQVIEDLRITGTEIDNVVIPSFGHSAEYFRTNKLKSPLNKTLTDGFYKRFDMLGSSKSASFIGDINRRLPYVRENVEYVKAQIEELMERDIINEGLTAKKALLVRAAESLSFISRYSIDLLNLVYINEAIETNSNVEESLRLSDGDVKKVTNNLNNFSIMLSDYGVPNKDFVERFSKVPEVTLSTRTASAIAGIYKERDVDPFNSAYIQGFVFNPIYHVRLVIADWQNARYASNADKKKMLELRLLHLRMLADKKESPQLENEIKYLEKRIDNITHNMREVEESLGYGD